ncbi:hypothetical protein ARMGADRAFT_80592 [Armillaria gallica]|uniref:Uncharacterized protein n=1 Tax=Armillaria gallica TaxID=47427 RepID=A0A2H3CG21_ARMGA|nr:hypothetical protein ARMGADRAFT_80592 [Armillaria gallica]
MRRVYRTKDKLLRERREYPSASIRLEFTQAAVLFYPSALVFQHTRAEEDCCQSVHGNLFRVSYKSASSWPSNICNGLRIPSQLASQMSEVCTEDAKQRRWLVYSLDPPTAGERRTISNVNSPPC